VARLFFALWPDALSRARLAGIARELARRVEGRAVPETNIHLTLAFLGEVEAARLDAVLDAGASLGGADFPVVLDRLGAFRRAQVAWAGCSAPAQELLELQSTLADLLASAGFDLEHRPFAPHLTLARKAVHTLEGESLEPPVQWIAHEVALVRTDFGTGRYTTLASWPLG
jgi:2'-5' RNA ligase